ncbi:hypothetical protein GGF32_007685 [Allomyces javanicus]|nr:hypothetical protein GGF32_007685 [Allomyces javanicus]
MLQATLPNAQQTLQAEKLLKRLQTVPSVPPKQLGIALWVLPRLLQLVLWALLRSPRLALNAQQTLQAGKLLNLSRMV